ncbi:ribonuclease P 40kDa subunit-domain-containing protein [Aspergillus cavernicola]|uniref:Ribonuclease P 40kDa subunit-domain-containing protein n=1 Tax=Aspergillus cavernicola TaxID=176166 RepID=A0ABR4IMA5_9EURO
MFELEDDDASGREKCYTTVAQLPQFIDPKQHSTTKSPFSAILGHPFVHTVEVTLPKEVYSTIESSLDSKLQKARYARLSMTLSSLIEGGFFNTYIKAGNILMISDGRSGLDNVYTLREGVLRLELGKEEYEKSGLTGKHVRTGGKKHGKERYLVELNLRLPSMLHGKKGFQRIEWAFKNVLNKPAAWLFFDLGTESIGIAEDDTTLKDNNPEIITCEPVRTTYENITTPSFSDLRITEDTSELDFKNLCGEVSEWLAMVSLGSHRVYADDDIDPYLCRYDAPEVGDSKASDLVSLKWHGFIPPTWITQLFITLFRETAPRSCGTSAWFALSVSALGRDAIEGKDGYTIMVLPPVSSNEVESTTGEDKDAKAKDIRHFICWEYVGASIL